MARGEARHGAFQSRSTPFEGHRKRALGALAEAVEALRKVLETLRRMTNAPLNERDALAIGAQAVLHVPCEATHRVADPAR